MRYYNQAKKNSTITVRVMCAIVFCLFCFSWLYWFQADLLTVVQHVLSGGATHYERTTGAILITVILQLLQVAVGTIVRLYRRSHALTYFPSMLLLAILSDVNADIDHHVLLGSWCWLAPLVLVAWGAAVWLARQIVPFPSDKEPTGMLSRRSWSNMLIMTIMMLAVAAVSNTNAVFHYRAHAEQALLHNDIDEALLTGRRSEETDASLTMLRAYALSLKGYMAERLFEYPIAGKGSDLLPLSESSSRFLLLSPDSLFRHLGARPRGEMTADTYYYLLERDTLATPALADYRLCGMLIDKDIDRFAHTLGKYYAIDDSLPKHYKEALTLYTHQRSKPVVVYHNPVNDEDWHDFQELEKQYSLASERRDKVKTRYATSYWYYFFYQ